MKTKLILKQVTIILCFLLFLPSLILGQEVDDKLNKTPQEMHDMFMKKSKTNKIAGFVFLGSGIALVATGIGINMQQWGAENANKGLSLSYIGTGLIVVSIPCFFSVGSNKRKAKLALKKETVVLGAFNNSNNYSLSVTLSF